jgi:hypothetical protein
MSLQTQAILPGHLTAAEIAFRLEQASGFKVFGYRTMRVPEHVLFELEDDGGTTFCVEAFLNSWAADDYAAAFNGPSTMLTMEHSHLAVQMLGAVAGLYGIWREHDMADWPITSSAR